jgi:cell division protein ZipA
VSHAADEPTIPSVSEVVAAAATLPRTSAAHDAPLHVQTPTLSESVAVASPARPATPARPTEKPAEKTVSPAARRKIVALRLAMPGVPGAQLQALLQAERLEYGRFNIFHRTHGTSTGTGTVFSVASMVEPGSFDPEQMAQQPFPGITLFMLLPGPLDGLIAYDQMLSCAQRLAHATHGTLQDDRGNPLTPQFMERLREEVLDFQHLMGNLPVSH